MQCLYKCCSLLPDDQEVLLPLNAKALTLTHIGVLMFKYQSFHGLQVYDESEPDTGNQPVIGEKGRKYKKVNWMKGAFLSADKLLTVSPTYAEEIAANESQGVELDGIIR